MNNKIRIYPCNMLSIINNTFIIYISLEIQKKKKNIYIYIYFIKEYLNV